MTPEELLAEDDRLLEYRREALRLWEPDTPFVVLGRSCKEEDNVHLATCQADGIPILRRSTGGGTVLQASGCLNFTFILNLEGRPELQNVTESYTIILTWVIRALRLPGLTIADSDLLYNGRKVGGNAQRRIPGWLLHHGTLLYGLDAALVARYLKPPPRQPAHRGDRRHEDFLGKLPLTSSEIEIALCSILPR